LEVALRRGVSCVVLPQSPLEDEARALERLKAQRHTSTCLLPYNPTRESDAEFRSRLAAVDRPQIVLPEMCHTKEVSNCSSERCAAGNVLPTGGANERSAPESTSRVSSESASSTSSSTSSEGCGRSFRQERLAAQRALVDEKMGGRLLSGPQDGDVPTPQPTERRWLELPLGGRVELWSRSQDDDSLPSPCNKMLAASEAWRQQHQGGIHAEALITGWLTKHKHAKLKKDHERWFVLYGDGEVHYFSGPDLSAHKGVFSVRGLAEQDIEREFSPQQDLLDLGEGMCGLKIHTPQRVWRLSAERETQARAWEYNLKNVTRSLANSVTPW